MWYFDRQYTCLHIMLEIWLLSEKLQAWRQWETLLLWASKLLHKKIKINSIHNNRSVQQFNSWSGAVKVKLHSCAITADVVLEISPCEVPHFVRWWCHCRKQSRKWFSGIPRRNVVTLRWTPGMSANLCPFRPLFLILERATDHRWLSQVNTVDGPSL
jgi:hypothetical protein